MHDNIPVGEATEVVDASFEPTTSLAVFSPIQQGIAELRQRYAGVAFDMRTVKGNEEARRARKELVSLRARADDAYESWNKPIVAQQRLARQMRDEIKAEVLALEQPIDEQIKADEARRAAEKAERERVEAARIKAHRDRISLIAGAPAEAAGQSAAHILSVMEALASIDISATTFEEFAEEADGMRSVIQQRLAAMHAVQAKAEEDAARLAEERRRADEERARLEEERRKLAAERAELEAQLRATREAEERRVREAERATEEARAQAEAAARAQAAAAQRLADERARLEQEIVDRRAALLAETTARVAAIIESPPEAAAVVAKPAPTEQVDAFAEERAAAAVEVAQERAAAPAPVRERPLDEELTAAIARHYKVTELVAAEWLARYDAFAEIDRVTKID